MLRHYCSEVTGGEVTVNGIFEDVALHRDSQPPSFAQYNTFLWGKQRPCTTQQFHLEGEKIHTQY